jgi:hypothetical protein
MWPEGLGKLIKIIHLFGSRTRDLPESSPVPRPLRYSVALFVATAGKENKVFAKLSRSVEENPVRLCGLVV